MKTESVNERASSADPELLSPSNAFTLALLARNRCRTLLFACHRGLSRDWSCPPMLRKRPPPGGGRPNIRSKPPSAASAAFHPPCLGSRVHSKRRRGGVERRQLELKGNAGGD